MLILYPHGAMWVWYMLWLCVCLSFHHKLCSSKTATRLPMDSSFLCPGEIAVGSPTMGAPDGGGVGKIALFLPLSQSCLRCIATEKLCPSACRMMHYMPVVCISVISKVSPWVYYLRHSSCTLVYAHTRRMLIMTRNIAGSSVCNSWASIYNMCTKLHR